MVTTARANKKIKGKAYDTSARDSKILVIMFEGEQFHLRSQYYPELYDEYISRKEIGVDFSGAKTAKDIDALHQQFTKKFKDFPTTAQITTAKKEYDMVHKNEQDSFVIEDLARSIMQDLSIAGANPRVSDERYDQIVEYLKDVIRAAADGKDVSKIGEKRASTVRKLLNKVTSNEPLYHTKHVCTQFINQIRNVPGKFIFELLSNLPEKRMTSYVIGNGGVSDDYYRIFQKKAQENMEICNKKYHELTVMLVKNKIRVDGLRTFDVMAKQHMHKLDKQEQHQAAELEKAVVRLKNQKQGLARKKMANMHGPIDPVARAISKIRKNGMERN